MNVSELQVGDDKTMGLIVLNLARECHEFALSRGIPSHSVDHQLGLVFSILGSHSSHLLNIIDVPTAGTSSLAGLSIGFSDEGYRLLAGAAKDRMANSVDADAEIVG